MEQGVRIANQNTIKKITSGRKSHRFASNAHFLCSLVLKAFIGFRKANSGEMCQNTLKWPIDLRARGVNLTTGATSMTSTSNSSTLNQREVKPRNLVQESSGRCLPPRQGVSDGNLKPNKGVYCYCINIYLLKITRKYHESIVADTHHWTYWVRPSLHTSSLSTPTPGTLSTRWPALCPAGQSLSAPVASTPAPAVICLISRSPLYVFQNDLNMIKPLIVFC